MLERKQKIYISNNDFKKIIDRIADDIDEISLSYGEIKALATGNKYILEKDTVRFRNCKIENRKTKVIKAKSMI